MPQGTIQAVRDAELRAEETEKTARQERENIAKAAKEQARAVREEMTRSVRDGAAQVSERAKAQGEAMLRAAEQEVQQDVTVLRDKAAQKQPQAIAMILDRLIG